MNAAPSCRSRLPVIAVTLLLSACTSRESPTSPVPQAQVVAAPALAQAEDMPTLQRFTLTIHASGDFRPNAPVSIAIDAVTNLPTPTAALNVFLPEVELAKASAWDENFSLQSRLPLLPAVSRSVFGASRGTTLQEETTVTIPAPGYYRVVATMKAPEGTPIVVAGHWVNNTAVAETWLLIQEDGGQSTPSFERNRVPAGHITNPGPFRAKAGRGLMRPERQRSPIPAHGPNVGEAESRVTDYITYHVQYYNSDDTAYQPVPSAHFVVDGCTIPGGQFVCEEEDWSELTSGYANSSGALYFECSGDEYEVGVATHAGVARFQVVGGYNATVGEVESDCGQTFDIVLPSNASRVFVNMDNAIDGFYSLFGTQRSFINVNLDDCPSASNKSCYRESEDEIYIFADDIWDTWGVFVAAHEYGHAFHEEELDGNEGGACAIGGPHFLNTESSLSCAFSEGFADFAAAAARPDLGTYTYRGYMESDAGFPGCVSRSSTYPYACTGGTSYEGSKIEAAFASFLYDLVDSTVEAHDSIAAPGSYVADIIKTCQVQYSGQAFRRANGTDEIAYCVENAINPNGYFTVRGATPINYSESASESGGWSSARARKGWTWNMYDKPY